MVIDAIPVTDRNAAVLRFFGSLGMKDPWRNIERASTKEVG